MIDLAPVVRLALLLVRPGVLIAAAPPLGGMYVPAMVKIALSGMLALALVPVVPWPASLEPAGVSLVLAREAMIGLALAFTVRLVLAGAELAGQLTGFQIGFAYASVADPQTGARNGVIASLYSSLTILVFLAIDGHHLLLRALVRSYAALPPGIGGVDAGLASLVARMLGFIIVFGVQLAVPIVLALLVVEVAMGLVSRAAPALNLMTLSFPLRVIAGMVVLVAAIGVVPGVVESALPRALALATRVAHALR